MIDHLLVGSYGNRHSVFLNYFLTVFGLFKLVYPFIPSGSLAFSQLLWLRSIVEACRRSDLNARHTILYVCMYDADSLCDIRHIVTALSAAATAAPCISLNISEPSLILSK
jgi:hypothetical protein